ncbi:MAG: flavodoxin family protein [Candidatus Latescibacterota bacterium]|nr:MAG: flavodoxin family protein [Candidatus Latescibacterota bacterium]
MKVLGLSGSPRRGGNTELLLDRALEGAKERGAGVEKIVLSELNIHPCRHCGGCARTGWCVIEDDMQRLYDRFRTLDALVLAAPVFFMGPPAQTKSMMDRCQCLWVAKYVLKRPLVEDGTKRKSLLLSVGGSARPHLFRPLKTIVQAVFATLDLAYGNDLCFAGVDKKGAIQKHPTALRKALEAGAKLVERA